MRASNDNSRLYYRRKPLKSWPGPWPEKRNILAWEIDSSLDPGSAEGQQVVGFG